MYFKGEYEIPDGAGLKNGCKEHVCIEVNKGLNRFACFSLSQALANNPFSDLSCLSGHYPWSRQKGWSVFRVH